MNEAYQALYKRCGKQEQRVIKAMQVAWLEDDRDIACGKTPESLACLAAINRRTAFLKSAVREQGCTLSYDLLSMHLVNGAVLPVAAGDKAKNNLTGSDGSVPFDPRRM